MHGVIESSPTCAGEISKRGSEIQLKKLFNLFCVPTGFHHVAHERNQLVRRVHVLNIALPEISDIDDALLTQYRAHPLFHRSRAH